MIVRIRHMLCRISSEKLSYSVDFCVVSWYNYSIINRWGADKLPVIKTIEYGGS